MNVAASTAHMTRMREDETANREFLPHNGYEFTTEEFNEAQAAPSAERAAGLSVEGCPSHA